MQEQIPIQQEVGTYSIEVHLQTKSHNEVVISNLLPVTGFHRVFLRVKPSNGSLQPLCLRGYEAGHGSTGLLQRLCPSTNQCKHRLIVVVLQNKRKLLCACVRSIITCYPYFSGINNCHLLRSKPPSEYGGHSETSSACSTYHKLVGLVHLSRTGRDVKLTLSRARQTRHLKHPTQIIKSQTYLNLMRYRRSH